MSIEPPAEVVSPTLTWQKLTMMIMVTISMSPPIEKEVPLYNILNLELQFIVYHHGGSDRRPHPSNTSAQSDAIAGNINKNIVSAKIVSREPPAEVAAPTLSTNITSKRAEHGRS